MGYGLKDLQPASLYITISIPRLAPYQPLPTYMYHSYLLDGLDGFDPTKYETSVANDLSHEELDWGIYWLNDDHHGTHYTLRRALEPDGITTTSSHVLHTATLPASTMRLNSSIVGLVRVLAMPPSLGTEIPSYLDWLTATAAPAATRTFIWATTAYMRCRKHVAHTYAGGEDGVREFDINQFLVEALTFAYGEVWHAVKGGALPRPVIASKFGVELLPIEEDDTGEIDEGGEGDGEDDVKETNELDSLLMPVLDLQRKEPISDPWIVDEDGFLTV